MAINLEDISEKSKTEKNKLSILELILQKKERKLAQRNFRAKNNSNDKMLSYKKRHALRPWQSEANDETAGSLSILKATPSEIRKCDEFLSQDEQMIRRIQKRAKELFQNVKP